MKPAKEAIGGCHEWGLHINLWIYMDYVGLNTLYAHFSTNMHQEEIKALRCQGPSIILLDYIQDFWLERLFTFQ